MFRTGGNSFPERAAFPGHPAGGNRDRGDRLDLERFRAVTEETGLLARNASVNAVREAVAEISRALHEQSQGIRKMAKLLEQVKEGTHAHERSTQHVDRSAHALLNESAALRAGIERFTIP
jgi:methyl-accepting chemotaxis protein